MRLWGSLVQRWKVLQERVRPPAPPPPVERPAPPPPEPVVSRFEAAAPVHIELPSVAPPPQSPLQRVRALGRALQLLREEDPWPDLAERFHTLRALLPPEDAPRERTQFLSRLGAELEAEVLRAHGTERLGYHQNKSGAGGERFVESGGIVAFNSYGDELPEVHFYPSELGGLWQAVSAEDSGMPMGDVAMLFRLDSEYFQRGVAEGGLRLRGGVLECDPSWLARQPLGSPQVLRNFGPDPVHVGVPVTEWVCPPLPFRYPSRAAPFGRLTGDERRLAELLMLHHLATLPRWQAL